MNEDPQDIFREMDAFADPLFARMARCFDTGIPQEYGSRKAPGDNDILPALSESPGLYSFPEICEPVPEVHRLENEVMVIAELPGATKDSVYLLVAGDQLIIHADGGVSQYHTAAALPPVIPGSMKSSIKKRRA